MFKGKEALAKKKSFIEKPNNMQDLTTRGERIYRKLPPITKTQDFVFALVAGSLVIGILVIEYLLLN